MHMMMMKVEMKLDRLPDPPPGGVGYATILSAVADQLPDEEGVQWGKWHLQRDGARFFTSVSLADGTVYGVRASYDGSHAIEITPGWRCEFNAGAGHQTVLGFMPAQADQRLKKTRHVQARVEAGALAEIFEAAKDRQALWDQGLRAAARQTISHIRGAAIILDMLDSGFPSTKIQRVRQLWTVKTGLGLLVALLVANSERGPAVWVNGQWEVPRALADNMRRRRVPVNWG